MTPSRVLSHDDKTLPHELPPEKLLALLGSDRKEGLSKKRAKDLLDRFGYNEIAELPPMPLWRKFLYQFKELVIWILIVAAVISGLLGDWPDTLAILAIVLLNAILGFVQEERAQRALHALRKLSAPHAKTLREGVLQTLPARELVPGDLIELEAGDHVPADARLIDAYSFKVQEASLTGESVPTLKDTAVVFPAKTALGDRRNMVHLGTVAATGKARAVVARTGMHTELGQIAGMLQRYEPEPTPLQWRLKQLGKVLVVVCLAIVSIIFGLQMLRGGNFVEVFLLSVSLAVAAVPEGLPAVVTIALALGLRRMVRRNALVRKLPSVETLGSVSVICSDKTGTLTRNEMTVRQIVAGDVVYRVTGTGYVPRGDFFRIFHDQEKSSSGAEEAVDPKESEDLQQLLKIAARCNNAQVVPPGNGSDNWQITGDPTEGALLVASLKGRVEVTDSDHPVLSEIPFDSERRAMSVVVEEMPGKATVYTKGAAEVILSKCVAERHEGRVISLTNERREQHLRSAAEMASQSLRVLGLAYRELPAQSPMDYQEKDLVFAGLAGMLDPPREEVKEAVRTCRQAGIRPIMITGDHPGTAHAIARELRLEAQGDRVITGTQLDDLSDKDLETAVETIAVYARVSPEHKLRVVRAWKNRGHVVAMTGDGVNDAPAVKTANIGIAMGITGTDVTKEASDMVLTDDNFASIVAAVEEGRGIFDNIQKFVHYLLSCNAGEVLFMFFAAAIGWPAPLMAIQILWINLVTDGLPALALAMEPPERDIMLRRPRASKAPVISYRRGIVMGGHGLLVAAAAATGFALVYGGDDAELPRARTVAFCIVAFAQLFYAVSCRSPIYTLPELGFMTNPYLWGAIAISALLQLAVVTLPFVQPIFRVSSPTGLEWGLVGGLALAPVTIIEIRKLVLATRRRKRWRHEAENGAEASYIKQ